MVFGPKMIISVLLPLSLRKLWSIQVLIGSISGKGRCRSDMFNLSALEAFSPRPPRAPSFKDPHSVQSKVQCWARGRAINVQTREQV
jgi:hypothetical protein